MKLLKNCKLSMRKIFEIEMIFCYCNLKNYILNAFHSLYFLITFKKLICYNDKKEKLKILGGNK